MPALPAGNGAVLAGLAGLARHGASCHAADPRRRARRPGVDALAARLGIGARHLDRLFRKHIGASPVQVARTCRVQRAKRLLDQTRLPMTEVALRAGFASLRRFNTVFAEVYDRPPSAIRRLRFKPV